jgi:hypothetical protein
VVVVLHWIYGLGDLSLERDDPNIGPHHMHQSLGVRKFPRESDVIHRRNLVLLFLQSADDFALNALSREKSERIPVEPRPP